MSSTIGDYIVESNRAIGTGTFASVLKATHSISRRHAAIKVMPKYRHNKLDAAPLNEIEALLNLKGIPGVIDLYDVYDDDENYYAALEYVPGTLLGFITSYGALSEEGARLVFRQLVEIVDSCHKRGFVHRDIKLENILFNPRTGVLRLIDFGMCAKIEEDRHNMSSNVIGSPGYIAPEILSPASAGYNGIKSDIYSLGVVLYALLFGFFPFADKDNFNYYDERLPKRTVLAGDLGFTPRNKIRPVPTRPSLCFPGEVSLEARSLLHHMLTTDFAKRATFAEIRKHPFSVSQKHDPSLFEQRRPSFSSPIVSSNEDSEEEEDSEEDDDERKRMLDNSLSSESIILRQELASTKTSSDAVPPNFSSSYPTFTPKRRQSRVRFALDDQDSAAYRSSSSSSTTSMPSDDSLDLPRRRLSHPRKCPSSRLPSFLPRRNSSSSKQILWEASCPSNQSSWEEEEDNASIESSSIRRKEIYAPIL